MPRVSGCFASPCPWLLLSVWPTAALLSSPRSSVVAARGSHFRGYVSAWAWHGIISSGKGPSPREGHAAVEKEGKIYVIGGCIQGTRCYNDVHVFDVNTSTWQQEYVTGEAPAPRGGHTATVLHDGVLIFGGASPAGAYGDAHLLDTRRKAWRRVQASFFEQAPVPRTNHATAADSKGRVHIFGGYSPEKGFLDDLWALRLTELPPDPGSLDNLGGFAATWTRTTPSNYGPAARQSHSLTFVEGKLALFGGSLAGGFTAGDAHVYDLKNQEWARWAPEGSSPSPRQGHSAARHGHEVIVLGGCDYSSGAFPVCHRDTWSLDIRQARWKMRSPEAAPWAAREGHTAAFFAGTMFTFGGCTPGDGGNYACSGSVEALETGEPCPDECGRHGECFDGRSCRCHTTSFGGHDCMDPIVHAISALHGAAAVGTRQLVGRGLLQKHVNESKQSNTPVPSAALRLMLDRATHGAMESRSSSEVQEEPLEGQEFGVDNVNENGHSGVLDGECQDDCNYRGLCEGAVCYCQPGFYGAACQTAQHARTGTMSVVAVISVCGCCCFLSFVVSVSLLYWHSVKTRQRETRMGYI